MGETAQISQLSQTAAAALATLTNVGLKIVGAVILWFIGRRLINVAMGLLSSSLKARGIDVTIASYASSSISVLLNIVLIVAILGFFGVETTSFAALLAAAGVAIGAAWSGLLANFAAGVFLVILRPFKVGDFISAGGLSGTVVDIGLFVTKITTPDNVLTIVGNNKLFSDNIQNFSSNPYRRVDLVAQLHHSVDPKAAIALLQSKLKDIPNVLTDPAPEVAILEFNLAGCVLAVRPYCHTDHYWQVYFDTNRLIQEAFAEANFPAPEYRYLIRQDS
jgi:small conductance mechanosensitive channel